MKNLIFLLILLPTLSWAQNAVSYPDRLAAIEEMASVLGDQYENGFFTAELGRFGGIYVQTEWQLNTGRDRIKSWNVVNHSLTIEPYKIFKSYLEKDSSACSDSSIKNKKICSAWLDFFQFADLRKRNGKETRKQEKLGNAMLWKAHEVSIDETLASNPGLLDDMNVPEDERLYLKGWIKFVHVLAISRLPTSEIFVRILAGQTSPACSPLGASHCLVGDQPMGVRVFVKRMISFGKVTENSMIDISSMLKLNSPEL